MGETGCGKTRLIKFLCDLYRPVGIEESNLILMKVDYFFLGVFFCKYAYVFLFVAVFLIKC